MTKPPWPTPLYFLRAFGLVGHILLPFGHIVTGRKILVAGCAPLGGTAYGHFGDPPLGRN